MKLAVLFTINAVVSVAFSIPLILFPGSFLPLYAVETTPGALFLSQFFGAALASFGLLMWLARSAS
jgi:hypothetical protein